MSMDETLDLARQIFDKIEEAEDEDRYRYYRDQLYGLGTAIASVLRENLTHRHHARRMAAATNLGRLGQLDAVPDLLLLTSDPMAGVREMAIFSLGILGDLSAADAILSAMHDYDSDVRYRALVALNDLKYPKIEEILIHSMSDESFGVREQALSQLRVMATPNAIAVVLKALLEREVEMQQMAEEILDRIVPKMTREKYKELREQLTLRERRLILNYLEARNLQEVYGALWKQLSVTKPPVVWPPSLDKYGRLLNKPDERKFLNHAYLRDETVNQLVEHFQDARASRSILLTGKAGVGKTAIIHELAHRLADLGEGENASWQFLETNTSELISGTRYLGDWETKLKEMAEALLKFKNVVLYITNPNDLLGAGAHSKSDENFADFFKPYLQRGQIRIIAECTEEDLKKGLARDPGFLRLFRQVKVHELDDAETLRVLEHRLTEYGARHECTVNALPGCLENVISFARSFFTRSVSPGRACDLLDALIDYASRNLAPGAENGDILLNADDIPACLSEITGMSLDLLDDTVPLDLQQTQNWFLERLIDQNTAVDTIVDRLALIKSGLGNPDKPLGVFFLVGPTGVGKTYFSKLVAERLFGTADRMLRFDLSEYQGRFAIEKLIGSPHDKDREGLLTEAVRNQPFSVLLFDEFEKADPEIFNLFLQILDEGRLTDARGETTDFRQTLIFLTSNLGASRTSLAPVGFGQNIADTNTRVHQKIHHKLDEFFAPEFLNRLDDVIVFEPLTEMAMERLVRIELNKAFLRRGFVRQNLTVEVDPSARAWLAEHGFSPRFGARELKRTIEKSVLTQISRKLIETTGPHTGKTIRLTCDNNQLVVHLPKGPASEKSVSKTPKAAPPRERRAPTRLEPT